MRYQLTPLLALAAAASAKTIDIDVGEGGIKFDPDIITAAVGDTLEFHFYLNPTFGPHSVVTADYNSPCVPAAGTFFSGLIPGDANGTTTWSTTIQDTNTKWIYCSSKQHCQNGMTAVINPPAAGSGGNQTLEGFKSLAKKVAAASAPASPTGGTTAAATGGSSPTTSPPASTTGAGGGTTSGPAPASTTAPGVAPRMVMDVGAVAGLAVGVAALLI